MRKSAEHERIEEELRVRLRDVFDNYMQEMDDDIEVPEPDLSFMYEDEKPEKKKNIFSSMSRIAASVAVLFLLSGSMAVWVNTESAHAMKFHVEKTFHNISAALFSTGRQAGEEGTEDNITISIASMDDIDQALDFMPDLPVPGYIPEGFELGNLQLTRFLNDSYRARYEFENKDQNNLIISSRYVMDDSERSDLFMHADKIEQDGREIYFWRDSYTSAQGMSILLYNQLVNVRGNVDTNILLDVISQIYIHRQ